jgi:hypothetical protein
MLWALAGRLDLLAGKRKITERLLVHEAFSY